MTCYNNDNLWDVADAINRGDFGEFEDDLLSIGLFRTVDGANLILKIYNVKDAQQMRRLR